MIARRQGGTSERRPAGRRRGQLGFSLVEAVVVASVMAILAAAVLPVVKFTITRQKEADLRHQLRAMRNAIDEYKRYSDAGLIPVELGTQGYPADLESLVEGIEIVGQVDMEKKFLRRIPVDPMTGEAEWGIRSYQDEPDSTSWSGENVYDVYSLSEGVGLNGVPYNQWMTTMSATEPTLQPAPPVRRALTRRPPRRAQSGFTIIELIIVVAIIGILAAMIMPALKDQPLRAKEAVLKTDLRTLRDVLDQYKGDKGYYPSSLEALVSEGYLRKIPIDPMTEAADWDLVYEEVGFDQAPPESNLPEDGQPGIYDVRSSSERMSLAGTPYSEW